MFYIKLINFTCGENIEGMMLIKEIKSEKDFKALSYNNNFD